MDTSRAVLITYARDGQRWRASGLHLREDLILTADHCAGGRDYLVWPVGWTGEGMPGNVAWTSGTAEVDVALLRTPALPEVSPVELALLDRSTSQVLAGCTSLCFPSFKRPNPAEGIGTSLPRGGDPVITLSGNIPLADNQGARLVYATSPASFLNVSLNLGASTTLPFGMGALSDEITRAWSGASGGGVVVISAEREYCIGVISARQVKEHPASLQVATFAGIEGLEGDYSRDFWQLVGVPYVVSPNPAQPSHKPLLPVLPERVVDATSSLLQRLGTRRHEIDRETFIRIQTRIILGELGLGAGGEGAEW